jgi:hypothetical protein
MPHTSKTGEEGPPLQVSGRPQKLAAISDFGRHPKSFRNPKPALEANERLRAAAGVSGTSAAGYLSGNRLLTATVSSRSTGQAAAALVLQQSAL